MRWPSFKKIFSKTADQASRYKNILVIDFGTASAKLLLCDYQSESVDILDGKKIVYPAHCVSGDELQHEGDLRPLFAAALEELKQKNKLSGLSAVVAGIGGLSVSGFTSQINYRRAKTKTTIEDAEFRSILKRIEERADQMMKRLIAWETASGEQAVLLGSEVLNLTVDGYEVATPVGSDGERLGFLVYNSYVKAGNLKKITGLLRSLDLELVSLTSSMYAVMRSVLEEKTGRPTFLVIDVGAATTEVGVVKSGRIIGHSGFDVAGESFSRSIADEFGVSPEEAELIKLRFSSGQLDREQAGKVREQVSIDCKVLASGVELLVKEFPGLDLKSSNLELCGGGGLLTGVASYLQSNWQDGGSPSDATTVSQLLPKNFTGFIDHTDKLHSSADVPPVCIALDARDIVSDFS